MMARLGRTRQGAVMAAAARLRDELNLPDDEAVDIFDVIRRVGIWLVFQPMDKVLGATLSAGSAGILITTQRDVTMQRFTAAHELGHHTLHRDEDIWDVEEDVDANPTASKEQEANVFAAHFLLPRTLLNLRLRHYGIGRSGDVPPEVVYLISRDLGLSYAATANRVSDVRNFSGLARQRLREAAPIDLKSKLLDGRKPTNARAQVWRADESEEPTFTVDVGDEMLAAIPENPSTGYIWTRAAEGDPDVAEPPVSVVESEFTLRRGAELEAAPLDRKVGAPGSRRLHLRAEHEGEWTERLTLRRPFEVGTEGAAFVDIHAVVRPLPKTVSSQFNTQLAEPDAE